MNDLTPKKTEKYVKLAGRLLCHSLDDPRVQFETGLVMRGMGTPRVLDKARLHRGSEIHCWNTWCGLAVSLAGWC